MPDSAGEYSGATLLQEAERLGMGGLSDADLLTLVIRGRSTELAHSIAEEYPLERLVTLPWDEIRRVKGLKEQEAAVLGAAFELAKRGLKRGMGSLPRITKPSDVLPVVADVRAEKREHFICLFLNARKQLLKKATISIGTLDGSLVHPREVFAPALEAAASAMILVHNHPSGDPSPSQQDISLTKRLSDAGVIMGVEVLDHVIVAEDAWVSLKQIGDM